MSDIDILDQMIKDSAKQPLSKHQNKMNVELAEPKQPMSSTIIYGVPENAVVIKVDTFPSPDAVFNGSQGECRRADYVIVSNANGKKVIVYIEMKATKGSLPEIIQQLKGAQCFIAYCREVGKSFWQEQDFLKGYRQRFISIGHTSIPKRKTRIMRQTGKHDRPEKMLKIDWPHYVQFNMLAGA
ncbi:conserved hypothetical protein [uncultured Desulfobacterium sp.]|uniref:Uncharacterized protein n=1 Tax=uncultured Desulfobacterium sp. TaxID=201089 RepID=A0A445MYI0_9BACT|nr:conserved hypothetical protein [uncultured Desulfobacterium sp.]